MAQDHSVFSNIQDNRTSSLAEQVADQINQVIIDQNINAGEKLPNEFELAARLNVGRGTIREAVKLLAARAGMPEPEEDDKTGRLRSRILSMNKEAARFFHACLNSTVEEARQARAYWRRRGLDE